MRGSQLVLCRADGHHIDTVLSLINEAAQWLRTKDTRQWASPWPNADARNKRIQADLDDGKTWIAWDGKRPAATITADPTDEEVWPEEMRQDPAVYVNRLVVSRRYAGAGVGARLIDWAGLRARREHGACWVRVDVWTDNAALHEYYRLQEFAFCGFCESIPDYPSAALFQKPTHVITASEGPFFREVSRCPG